MRRRMMAAIKGLREAWNRRVARLHDRVVAQDLIARVEHDSYWPAQLSCDVRVVDVLVKEVADLYDVGTILVQRVGDEGRVFTILPKSGLSKGGRTFPDACRRAIRDQVADRGLSIMVDRDPDRMLKVLLSAPIDDGDSRAPMVAVLLKCSAELAVKWKPTAVPGRTMGDEAADLPVPGDRCVGS